MDIDCKHKLGHCPWACEGYVNYCVVEKQNPSAYYTTEVLTEVTKQKEDYLITAFENVGINPNIIIEQDALINKLQSQLNAVRELHKPEDNYGGDVCKYCFDMAWEKTGLSMDNKQFNYPCPTIQAIEKELAQWDL